jgi:hypothetical protein
VPVVIKLKEVYKEWYFVYLLVPKLHRYTLAQEIDHLFVELLEMSVSASFVPKLEKAPYLKVAIRKLDTIKVLLTVLWELDSLKVKEYIRLSEQLHTTGKMLGGWLGQAERRLEKQNSPAKSPGRKK